MASSGPIQPERKSFLFAPWRPVLDPVDARHCRLLSQIQLSTLVIGFIAICIPSWLDRGATLPRDPAALAAFAGLGLVLALYIVNRLGYVRFASAGTMLTLSVMVWQYPFLARHELSSWSYFYLALPVLLTDMLLSTPMLAFIIALNLLPMLVVPIVLPEISLDEMPIVFYAMASVFVVAGRRHRANLEAARQRELHASHERYRGLLEAAFEGVALEEGGVLRRVNAGFSRIFGCPAGAAPGKPLRAFIPDWGEGPREALRVYAGRAADGGERFVQVIARQLEDAPAAALMIGIRDVTAEKQFEAKRQQMEEQLQQTQKLESLGLLAGGIAHDFNNQLAAILGQASLLDMELPGGTPANEAARTIVRAAEQAASMTEKLLGFARQGKHQSVALDLHETLREVQVLLRHILDKNIEVACDAGAGNSRIKGDPVQLQQVFLNLAINARDAMPRGGRLLFRTENAELSSAPERAPAAAPGNYTVVRVSDTGCGIPAEVLPRIFDPFFTTKQVGQGTGLGLAMVYGIVQSHGGYIEVQSSAGAGTEFAVFLPATEEAIKAPVQAAPYTPGIGMGNILVIDDEDMVRNMVRTLLGRLGYKTELAEDGRKGVEYYREHWKEVDAIIVDMIMPVMSGEQCFHALREINPDAKIVLSSGFDINEKIQRLLDEGALAFIKKPYRFEELMQTIERAMTA